MPVDKRFCLGQFIAGEIATDSITAYVESDKFKLNYSGN